jgi:hypothetical protein
MLLFYIFVEDMNTFMYFSKIYSGTEFENTAFIDARVSPTPQGVENDRELRATQNKNCL